MYQAYGLTGTIGVFEINGTELTLVQEFTGALPTNNIQGIVSVGTVDVISSTSDEILSSEEINFNVYPNPSDGNTISINFDLDERSDYSISIIGVNGAVVSNTSSFTRSGERGSNTVQVSDMNLSPGIYLVKLNLDNGSISQKFIVQK